MLFYSLNNYCIKKYNNCFFKITKKKFNVRMIYTKGKDFKFNNTLVIFLLCLKSLKFIKL